MLKPQKVLHLKDALKLKSPKLQGNYFITEKFDGWYVQIPYNYTEREWEYPVSSNGRIIPAFKWVKKYLKTVNFPKPNADCYLIIEAIIPDTPFHILNGIFNRSIGDCTCTDVIFKVHDIVFLTTAFAASRMKILDEYDFSSTKDLLQKVAILDYIPYSNYHWQYWLDTIVNRGGEGIVAKRESGLYLPGKRTTDLLKLKMEVTLDLLADRIELTTGDKGQEGVTLISKRKNGVEVRTVINAHKDIDYFKQNNISNIVVEIGAMEELENGQLRQPVFRCFREDKLPEDID